MDDGGRRGSNMTTGKRYFSKTFRPALGLTQREPYFSGLKRPVRGDRHSPISSVLMVRTGTPVPFFVFTAASSNEQTL